MRKLMFNEVGKLICTRDWISYDQSILFKCGNVYEYHLLFDSKFVHYGDDNKMMIDDHNFDKHFVYIEDYRNNVINDILT